MLLLSSIVIFAALLPVAMLAISIYKQDSAQPEPPKWLWKAGFYGVISAFIALLIGSIKPEFVVAFPALAGTVRGAIGTAFCDAALPEEFAKLLMLIILVRKNPYFDEHLDGIVYATCIGLGFAGFENILYLATNLNSFVSVAVQRAIFSVPGHFFFAVAMGYFFSLGYFGWYPRWVRNIFFALAFIVPVILHGIFDGLLMSGEAAPEISGPLFIIFIIFCIFIRKKGKRKIQRLRLR